VISIKAKFDGILVSKRAFEATMLGAGLHTMKHWRDTYAPIHFTREAYRRYEYAKRFGEPGTYPPPRFNKTYTGIKLRGGRWKGVDYPARGHTRPLDWTGKLKSDVLGGKTDAEYNSNGRMKMQLKFNNPVVTLKAERSNRNYLAELSVVTTTELGDLDRTLQRRVSSTWFLIGKSFNITKTHP